MTYTNILKQVIKLKVSIIDEEKTCTLSTDMCEIKTLVYCDLEATGLKNSGRPRITELSLVAVNTESILDLNTMLLSHLPLSKLKVDRMLPRVVNKLTICVYPMTTIRPEVSGNTGQDNYNRLG